MHRNIENFHDSLGSIKDQLFDAPNEVKAAFNTIVGWFDLQYFGKSSKSSRDKSSPYDEARLYRDSAFKKVFERFDFDDPKDCKKFVSLYKRIFNAIKKVAKPGDFKDPTSLWAKKLINQIISNYPDFNTEDIGSLNVDLSHFGGYGNKFELLAKPTSENEDKYGYSLVIANLNNKY